MSNPLLQNDGLPAFAHIKPEHVEPAIDTLLAECRANIARLLDDIADHTWENTIEPIEEWEDRLSRAWSPVSHMNSVVNSDELRAAYNVCLPKLSEYGTEMGQNRQLYEAYKQVSDRADELGLDTAQRKVLSNALRDFHLSGVDLPADEQARYKAISQQLSELTSNFSDNLLDATNAWSKQVDDESALAGMPPSAIALARQTAEQRGETGYMLTLDFPSYYPVLTYADDAALRRELYQAYNTRASDQGPHAGQWDNSSVMEQILALRQEKAHLLGFANYAEYSLVTKMARSGDEVIDFLEDLASHSKAQGERELTELRAFAREQHDVDDLDPWDISYYAEKLRQHRHAISSEEVKPYFPETRVVPGMFSLIGKLFAVIIHEVTTSESGGSIEVWHPDVKFYEIRDAETGEVRGQFYFDLYARAKKRGGAWMDDCQGRIRTHHREQIPVAYMTCNFTPPVDGKPALLTHDEVETLFHEFGHGLHHMLTRIDYPAVSGISGVAWDAVELPSQFMENFCWQREGLDLIAGHYETGEPIPEDLYQRMMAAKNFQSAMMMLRQLEFALFDFRIHMGGTGGERMSCERIYQVLDEVRDQVAVIKPPDWNRFPHGFSHIFAGGYAAGYYSYKWAEVLSADAFSLFEENGVLDTETGRSFLHHILEKGGSRDAMELFVAFRGREPKTDALLRHSGIAA